MRSLRLSWRPCSAGGAAAAGVHADMAGAAAGVMDLDVVQAAAARLVMAAIILRAIQIRHTKHLRP